jgi:hypothetical protein
MMELVHWLCIMILMVLFSVSALAQEGPHSPLYTIDLSSLVPQGAPPNANGTVVFLTDHVIAVGMCYKSACNLQTFDLANGSPRKIGEKVGIEHYRAALRSVDGRVLLGGVRRQGEKGAVLLDQDLHTSQWIPSTPGVSVVGEKIPEGPGRLLTHANNLAAYLDQGTIRIYGKDGKPVGAFEVGLSKGRVNSTVSFLGRDRILFQGSGNPEIRDFNGTVLRTLKKPGGALGERTKQSEDGSRLLYDSFTRRVGLAQDIKEKALILPSMGMSTDGDVPNGEVVRVIDTGSGKQCFEWYGKEKLLPPFVDHADVDPSGQLVAIMTRGALAIFRLPDVCTVK